MWKPPNRSRPGNKGTDQGQDEKKRSAAAGESENQPFKKKKTAPSTADIERKQRHGKKKIRARPSVFLLVIGD